MAGFLTFEQIDKIVDECAALNGGICNSGVFIALKAEAEAQGKDFALERMTWESGNAIYIVSSEQTRPGFKEVEVLYDNGRNIDQSALSEYLICALKYSKVAPSPVNGLENALKQPEYSGIAIK
jgi:hypothetical protein